MKYITTFSLIKNIVLISISISISIIIISTTSFANTDDVNLITMIPSEPKINVKAYILMDYNSGKVLAENNADVRHAPASLTKIMTSYVIGQAVKLGKISVDDKVIISNDAWATNNPIFKGSSLMFLKPGDTVPVFKLIRGIDLQSGNDACVAMADYIAGNQDFFVNLMNNYVTTLRLQNTYFKTVHGLDADQQYSSARDMALISQALIHDVPNEYAIYKEKEFTFNNIRQLNRNGLLWDQDLKVDGIKTGHTLAAGYNLVASATEGQMRLISVVLGSKSFKEREIESKKLLTWGFRFFETIVPLKANKEFISKPTWFGNDNTVQLSAAKDVYLTIPRGKGPDVKVSYTLNTPEIYAPLVTNQVVGTINFQLDGKIIAQHPLVVMKEVKQGSIFKCFIDYIKLVFHHLFG
ncbi:D-alanyl-D-alanine carboxypeptidase DacA [Candidatus Fukatsuia anoeciicola]|uniref:D-alanyl-D-alanine carboxypeptidase DacA n=1 Tax=Candidatus Fukatsuia anoeciicola TaxID=2994492 RepID=UPI0034644113